jgi:hypothetical protein
MTTTTTMPTTAVISIAFNFSITINILVRLITTLYPSSFILLHHHLSSPVQSTPASARTAREAIALCAAGTHARLPIKLVMDFGTAF